MSRELDPGRPARCFILLAAYRGMILLLTAISFLNAQPPLFGTVRSFPIPDLVDRMTLLPAHTTGNIRFLLWSRGRESAWLGSLNPDRSAVTWLPRQLPDSVHILISDPEAGIGRHEIVGVGLSDSSLFVIPNVDADTLREATRVSLPFLPAGILPIGGPQEKSLMVFSPGIPGILPVIGVDGKNPRLGKPIVPDIPVGDIIGANLNDDGIPDLILYDWVRSELHFLYGVGNTRFLDQTTFPVQNGVSRLLPGERGDGETLDIFLVSADSLRIELWHGDGLGDFTPQSASVLLSPVRSSKARDLNGDGWPDIAYIDLRGALHFLLNTGREDFEDGPEVSAGMSPQSFEFASNQGSASFVLDPVGKQLLVFEESRPRVLTDSLVFAAGLAPSGLVVGDMNNDSHGDIAVVAASSASLEFFLSDSTGALAGVRMLRLNSANALIGLHSVSDSLARFIVTSPAQGSISFVSYHVFDRSHSEALIPGVGALEPIYAEVSHDGRIGYYCYGAPGESVTSSLSFFQQLGGERFIERSFKLTIPDTLMGAAVADLNNDHHMDVAYVYRNATTSAFEFATAYGDSTNEFSRRGASVRLEDSTIAKSYLYVADVNKDSLWDILFCFPKNARTLRLALGDSVGAFSAATKISENIGISDRAQLELVDLDQDGCIDIAVNDSVRGGIGYLKGDGRGGFASWKSLYLSPGISHFGFGDFNNDGVKDLVVAVNPDGIIKIINGTLIVHP